MPLDAATTILVFAVWIFLGCAIGTFVGRCFDMNDVEPYEGDWEDWR